MLLDRIHKAPSLGDDIPGNVDTFGRRRSSISPTCCYLFRHHITERYIGRDLPYHKSTLFHMVLFSHESLRKSLLEYSGNCNSEHMLETCRRATLHIDAINKIYVHPIKRTTPLSSWRARLSLELNGYSKAPSKIIKRTFRAINVWASRRGTLHRQAYAWRFWQPR
jgi:hypothetical protein